MAADQAIPPTITLSRRFIIIAMSAVKNLVLAFWGITCIKLKMEAVHVFPAELPIPR